MLRVFGVDHRIVGNSVTDHGTGAGGHIIADLRTGPPGRLPAPDVAIGADLGTVLVHAVIVGGDGATADVRVVAKLGVSHIAQVRHLGAVTDVSLLHLDECTGLASSPNSVARTQVGPRSDVRARAMWDSCTRERSTTAPSSTVASINVVYGRL